MNLWLVPHKRRQESPPLRDGEDVKACSSTTGTEGRYRRVGLGYGRPCLTREGSRSRRSTVILGRSGGCSVAITPEQNVTYLEAVLAKANLGAQAAAQAMADYVADRTANETLTQRINPPGTYYKARPGEPPSYGSGALAESMYSTPASGGLRSSALVGSTDRRARVFEFGSCILQPTRKKLMGWKDSKGIWRHRWINMEEHPFLGPTTEDAIDDGELHRIAIEAFREYDP